ncbi:redoxin domain-containing protein [Deinococcus radiomollis]|uniref:redoxin domain-containing protein n=1 Tax=Deinococcus radiomollis TaxID=468916 RepID=UPI003891A554
MPTTSALSAALDAAHSPLPIRLSLSIETEGITTRLQFFQGRITGVSSPLAPAWSSLLIGHGLSPSVVASAQQVGFTPGGTLATLLERQVVTSQELADLSRDRVLAALVPMALQEVKVHASETAPPRNTGGINAEEGIHAAEAFAAQLTAAERKLRSGDRFYAVPTAASHTTPDSTEDKVYRLALQGLPLGEIAYRLPMRWDQLVRAVTTLIAIGALGHEKRAQSRSPLLRPGDLAPDFRLPVFGGGDLKLSQLRGKKVWLVFNRQATCMMCNPHNAAIIALHDQVRAAGIQVVTVWGSELKDLHEGIGQLRPPYPLLSDPQDVVYDGYGLQRSLLGALDSRNMPTIRQGLAMVGLRGLKADGEFTRMPAEFLIDEQGRVAHAHYNAYGTDWMPMEKVLTWAALNADPDAD